MKQSKFQTNLKTTISIMEAMKITFLTTMNVVFVIFLIHFSTESMLIIVSEVVSVQTVVLDKPTGVLSS